MHCGIGATVAVRHFRWVIAWSNSSSEPSTRASTPSCRWPGIPGVPGRREAPAPRARRCGWFGPGRAALLQSRARLRTGCESPLKTRMSPGRKPRFRTRGRTRPTAAWWLQRYSWRAYRAMNMATASATCRVKTSAGNDNPKSERSCTSATKAPSSSDAACSGSTHLSEPIAVSASR